ncbi:MAG: hypothetical protein AAGI48_08585 [Verrucomicrobiota bacterium]
MSPLPNRKKTPEELAALRESLGISPEGPPPGAPGTAAAPSKPETPTPAQPTPPAESEGKREAAELPAKKQLEPPAKRESKEPEAEPELESEPSAEMKAAAEEVAEEPVVLGKPKKKTPEARPVRSLRKSERLPVDQPKRAVARNSGELPTRRHTDQELARLRHQPANFSGPPPSALTVAWPMLVVIYGFGSSLIVLAVAGAIAEKVARIDLPFDWLRNAVVRDDYRLLLFGVMAAGAGAMLVGAAWIFFKRPSSSFHSAFLTIIAVLVLVFGTLYLFPGLHGA